MDSEELPEVSIGLFAMLRATGESVNTPQQEINRRDKAKEIKDKLYNKYSYGQIPIQFIGARI